MRRRALAVASLIVVQFGLAGVARAASPDPNLLRARAEAARLLALVPLPAGTQKLTIDPFTGKPFAPPGPPEPWQVLVAGNWLAPVKAVATRRYMSSHLPPGATQAGISFTGSPLDWGEILNFPTSPRAITYATVEISIAPYGRSQTEISAQAQLLWKPTWEQIPTATRALAVSVDGGPSVMVSGHRKIAGLAAFFDRLRVQAESFSCPVTDDPQHAVVRLIGSGGHVLGTLRVEDYGCKAIYAKIGTRHGAPLWDSGVLDVLWREHGVRACRASQLTGSVTPTPPHRVGSLNIEIRNTSDTECSVDGYPRLEFRTPEGRRLDIRLAHQRYFSVALATVAPHGRLVINGAWPRHHARCTMSEIGSIAIRMPRMPGSLVVSAPTPISVCGDRLAITPMFNPGLTADSY